MTISVWVFPETANADVSLELIAAIKQGYLTVKATGVWSVMLKRLRWKHRPKVQNSLGLIWITNISAVLIPALGGGIILMANTNNLKAFALDPNANVMLQADWEVLPALLSDFTAGKASAHK